jgi:hypothetical protein
MGTSGLLAIQTTSTKIRTVCHRALRTFRHSR